MRMTTQEQNQALELIDQLDLLRCELDDYEIEQLYSKNLRDMDDNVFEQWCCDNPFYSHIGSNILVKIFKSQTWTFDEEESYQQSKSKGQVLDFPFDVK